MVNKYISIYIDKYIIDMYTKGLNNTYINTEKMDNITNQVRKL